MIKDLDYLACLDLMVFLQNVEETHESASLTRQDTAGVGAELDDLLFSEFVFPELGHELLNFDWLAAE